MLRGIFLSRGFSGCCDYSTHFRGKVSIAEPPSAAPGTPWSLFPCVLAPNGAAHLTWQWGDILQANILAKVPFPKDVVTITKGWQGLKYWTFGLGSRPC